MPGARVSLDIELQGMSEKLNLFVQTNTSGDKKVLYINRHFKQKKGGSAWRPLFQARPDTALCSIPSSVSRTSKVLRWFYFLQKMLPHWPRHATLAKMSPIIGIQQTRSCIHASFLLAFLFEAFVQFLIIVLQVCKHRYS
ncbi:hypothetical protein H6P81_011065 [Aristolochia fimbriata]|uniref:Uncharacterized protein n=1 Tax=Aristolochia fimbriata TaxID=158543 RepID=A0AAV7EQH5_ARIFI|nr:hypothetical protein H6P81_011065 [Aristolochia fimbriata]